MARKMLLILTVPKNIAQYDLKLTERVTSGRGRVSKMKKRALRSEPDQYLITSNTDRH